MRKEIDKYSYHLGAADCFCEMVSAGVKIIALSHPCESKEERDSFIDDFEVISKKYNVSFYIEDDPLLTELFPISLNKNKYNVIFYLNKQYLSEYLSLKKEKEDLLSNHQYSNERRYDLAYRYGKLLSYDEERINHLIQTNIEKESI